MKRNMLLNIVLVLGLLAGGCAAPTPVPVSVMPTQAVKTVAGPPAEIPAMPTPPSAEFPKPKIEGKEPQKVVSGKLEENTTWDSAKVISVTGTVTVPVNITLTIKEGTVVVFKDGQGLDVHGGKLKAEGTEKSPIYFQSETEKKGSWEGISIAGKGASADFKFCQMRFGKSYNIRIGEGAKATIASCEISNAKKDGIHVRDVTTAIIDSNRIHDNLYGIHVLESQSGSCEIKNNVIYDQSHPFRKDGTPEGAIANGIHLWNHASCNVHHNTLVNTKRIGWGIEIGYASNPEIKDNIITGFEHGIIVHEVLEAKDTIQKGNLIEFPKGIKIGDAVRAGDRVLFGARSKPTIENNWLWNNIWDKTDGDYSEQVVAAPGKIYRRDKTPPAYGDFVPVPLPDSNYRTNPEGNQKQAADPKFCDLSKKNFGLKDDSPEEVKNKGAYPVGECKKP